MTKILNLNEYRKKNEPPSRSEKVYIPVYDPTGACAGEHPWVIVKEETEDRLIGTLNNHPALIDFHGFRFGDEIEARRVNGLWQVVTHPAERLMREEFEKDN
jgi:hypothetical protein